MALIFIRTRFERRESSRPISSAHKEKAVEADTSTALIYNGVFRLQAGLSFFS